MSTGTLDTTEAPATTTLRILPADEWPRLAPLFTDSFPGRAIPAPAAASCAVIERPALDGSGPEIVAAMFFVLAYHMEPFCARKGYGSHFAELALLLESMVTDSGIVGYYVTAHRTSAAIARERALGRTVLTDHVPAFRVLGSVDAALAVTPESADASTGVESPLAD